MLPELMKFEQQAKKMPLEDRALLIKLKWSTKAGHNLRWYIEPPKRSVHSYGKTIIY